jgi:hypothetical protein
VLTVVIEASPERRQIAEDQESLVKNPRLSLASSPAPSALIPDGRLGLRGCLCCWMRGCVGRPGIAYWLAMAAAPLRRCCGLRPVFRDRSNSIVRLVSATGYLTEPIRKHLPKFEDLVETGEYP